MSNIYEQENIVIQIENKMKKKTRTLRKIIIIIQSHAFFKYISKCLKKSIYICDIEIKRKKERVIFYFGYCWNI